VSLLALPRLSPRLRCLGLLPPGLPCRARVIVRLFGGIELPLAKWAFVLDVLLLL